MGATGVLGLQLVIGVKPRIIGTVKSLRTFKRPQYRSVCPNQNLNSYTEWDSPLQQSLPMPTFDRPQRYSLSIVSGSLESESN